MDQIIEFKQQFLEILRLKLGNKKNWAEELAELLHCTKANIYKKVTDDNFFLLSDIIILTNHYKLSLDKIIYKDQSRISFIAPNASNPINDVDQYLARLESIFTQMSSISNPSVYYASRELPIFYYFINKHLAFFKLYVFSRTIWKINAFKDLKYSNSIFDQKVADKATYLWEQYSSLKSVEYWNSNIIDSTIQQVTFYFESGDLTLADAHLILNGLTDVIKNVKEMTLASNKREGQKNNFLLFENKILHTNNHIMVLSDQYNGLYITFDNPNFLFTDDKEFLNYTINWYKTIQDNSYQLGHGSGHHTSIFFTLLEKKIENIRSKLEIMSV